MGKYTGYRNQLELKSMIDADNVDDGSFNKNMLGYMSRRHAELGNEKLGRLIKGLQKI